MLTDRVNDGNGALDSGTEINVSGGILIAAGSSGMAEFPSDTSTQPSLVVGFEQSLDAGRSFAFRIKR